MLQAKIPSQRFELIRDAIGRVLTAEFVNQLALGGGVENLSIFSERSQPLDSAELPAINIILSNVDFPEELNAYNSLGDDSFLIEIYTNAETTEEQGGDVASGILLARIAGMVRAILMDNQYLRLDFTDKFIQTRKVKSFIRTQPRIALDVNNTISGIVQVHYYSEETTEVQTGVVEQLLSTVIKLENTQKGYKFIIQED
jgi:hypothetical protein